MSGQGQKLSMWSSKINGMRPNARRFSHSAS